MLYPAHYLYLYLCLYLYYCLCPLDLRPLRLPFIMTIAISQCLRLEQARFVSIRSRRTSRSLSLVILHCLPLLVTRYCRSSVAFDAR